MSSFIYPVVAHAAWAPRGFASPILLSGAVSTARARRARLVGCGVYDFAGAGVVHLTGGIAALVASKVIGPRQGRFEERDGKIVCHVMEQTSLIFQVRRARA